MKKIISIIMAFCIGTALLYNFTVSAETPIYVYIDGTNVQFDVFPTMQNNRVLVPMRAIFEALDAEITWIDWTQTVIAAKNDITITLQIGNSTMYKDGVPVSLDVPPQLIDNRTLVPVRAISESLGVNVDWDNNTNSVIIKTPQQSKPSATLPVETYALYSEPQDVMPNFKIPSFEDIFKIERAAYMKKPTTTGYFFYYVYDQSIVTSEMVNKYEEIFESIGFSVYPPDDNISEFGAVNDTSNIIVLVERENGIFCVKIFANANLSTNLAEENVLPAYKECPYVPDFGALNGIQPTYIDLKQHPYYSYNNYHNNDPESYLMILAQVGFVFDRKFYDDTDNLVYVYTLAEKGITVYVSKTNLGFTIMIFND